MSELRRELETFAGGPGSSCGVTVDYDAGGGYAAIVLNSCRLVGAGAETATLDGEFEYAGCDVQAP